VNIVNYIRENKYLTGLVIFTWLFLFSTTVSKTYSHFLRNNLALEPGFIFFRAFVIWGVIALFIPLILLMGKKFPILGEKWWINASLHFIVSFMFMPLHAIIYRLIMVIRYGSSGGVAGFFDSLANVIMWMGVISSLVYWLVIGAYHVKLYYTRYRDRQLRTMQLEAELTSIRLQVLKMQLHPHFLFNTLHNINTLIYEDVNKAKKILIKLKQLLQISFNKVNEQVVKLSEELEFTSTYLEIESTRFSDRLFVDWKIDPVTRDAYVPSFILQPLVENAIRHGISKQMKAGTIRISSDKIGDWLILMIDDEGPGLNGTAKPKTDGVGLGNIRSRLKQLYGNYQFRLNKSDLGGVKVIIKIPYATQKDEIIVNQRV